MAGPITTISIPFEIAVGVGVGAAVGDTVVPKLENFKNTQWTNHPNKALPAGQAALASVKGFPTALALAEEAAKQGYSADVFGAMEQNLRQYPPTAELLELWRRARLSRDEVDLALTRALIPEPYRTAVLDLFTGRLDPAIIATAIQRGIMTDPGFLPVGPPSAAGKVPKFPVSGLDPLAEAKAHGIDEARLFVETAIVGLPASNEQAANAYFRGIIELADYYRAIAEGNTRNEWRDAILEQSRQILTANQYAELELRGFLTKAQRRTQTAKHGMSDADSDHLFDVLGRSVNTHQIVTGEARGGVYKPPPATLAEQSAGIPPAFLASLQRGNLRPEYYDLAYANRYTYPSFFAIRGLLQGGVFATADDGYQILLEMGWKPSLARLVADFYWKPGATTTSEGPRVKSAQTSAITEIRAAFLIGQADETQARDWLGRIGVDATEIDGMLPIWNVMLEVPQRGLTPSQIKKAYRNLPASWPRDRALSELELLGLTADDAATLLDE